MNGVFRSRGRKDAQTLVFFLIAWATIMLLAGLAIDSGLLYLAKARMSRAVDGAALAAVGNFNRNPDPATNRDQVALIMRNFAAANFTDLSSISATATPHGGTASQYTLPNGTQGTSYTYNFNDGTQDALNYRRFVQVVLNTGSGGAITSATCNARCPVQTYFIGYATYAINGKQNVKIGGYSGPPGLVDLKVSSSAVATRNPRLIMVVIDRSASMLAQGGGAAGLPPAVVQFLDFFDTSSDNIGIVSFGSSARLEMPMTTNFIIAGTNNLIDSYNNVTNSSGGIINAEPGVDPESKSASSAYDPNYATTGVRRLKFGGDTAADDGIRLALEQLMANAGFNDPDVVKYMVLFTDGKWNASRTMLAAPGYTNTVTVPGPFTGAAATTNKFVANTAATTPTAMTNGQSPGPWISTLTNDMSANSNLVTMPTLSPLPGLTNALTASATNDFANLVGDHTKDIWQSSDGTSLEPLGVLNTTQSIVTNSMVASYADTGGINYFTHNLDVWLQPGSVDYLYHSGAVSNTYVSDYTKPNQHINLYVNSGDSNVLVVPGYIVDGVVYDGLDLTYPDNPAVGASGYNRYATWNFQQPYMWPDDTGGTDDNSGNYYTASLMRQLMFRNYANLLTGYYVFRPDEPLATYTSSNPKSQGVEPLITEQNPPGAPRPLYGLGAYYPSAGFYWPFGGETNAAGIVTNAVGVDVDPTYGLMDPNSGLPSGARHIAYSINMLSTNAQPEWAGELFYKSSNGGGTNTISTTASASTLMQSGDWKIGLPTFASSIQSATGVMTNEPTHNTNIVGSPSVWRPLSFVGIPTTLGSVFPGNSLTGGFVTDGAGHYFTDSMAWSGRPTHYYDFSKGSWEPIPSNHVTNANFLQIGNWKAWEYCWHARALGVTIYTVGYGTLVTDAQQLFLAQLANSTNTTAGGGSNISFNANQPIGQQFYATNSVQISNDFYQVGQAINAALTQ